MPIIALSVECLSPLRLNSGLERPCIPATTLKGRTRVEFERLAVTFEMPICRAPHRETMCHPVNVSAPCIVCQLFGSPWQAGTVYFEELTTSATPVILPRARISLSRVHGVRMDLERKLESLLPAGSTLSGRIQHSLSEPWKLALLIAALHAIASFGMGYGTGGGQCKVSATAQDQHGQSISPTVLAEALRAVQP